MKNKIILALLVISCSCNAQKKQDTNSHTKKVKMERFDKKRFEAHKVNGEYTFTLQDGSEVRQWETVPEYYVEQVTKARSPFETYKEFHYDSGFLKTEGTLFYNFKTGPWREYDVKGQLIKETNEDAPYKFSITDLDKMMRKEGVNIMEVKPGVQVNRFIDDNDRPLYGVTHPVDAATPYHVYKLLIDGNTGKVLEKTTAQIRK
jgi:hypothetical protein